MTSTAALKTKPVLAPTLPKVNDRPAGIPGFKASGDKFVALGDEQVWGLTIGKEARPVNTAAKHSSEAIDGWERTKLLKLAMKSPQEFLQRLMADSMNGTPVDFQLKKLIDRAGILTVDFRAENGAVETNASFDLFNKVRDKHLKAYAAKGADLSTRSRAELSVAGQLNADGGIDGVSVELSIKNIPAIDADKIVELEQMRKELRKVLKDKTMSKTAKEATLLDLFDEATRKIAEFPIFFLIDMIDDSGTFILNGKEKGKPTTAKATFGDGKYKLELNDLLGKMDGEAKINGEVKGTADDSENTFTVDKARIFNHGSWSLSWGEGNEPVVYRVDPKTGKKDRISDHAAELVAYAPMVMALAGGVL